MAVQALESAEDMYKFQELSAGDQAKLAKAYDDAKKGGKKKKKKKTKKARGRPQAPPLRPRPGPLDRPRSPTEGDHPSLPIGSLDMLVHRAPITDRCPSLRPPRALYARRGSAMYPHVQNPWEMKAGVERPPGEFATRVSCTALGAPDRYRRAG